MRRCLLLCCNKFLCLPLPFSRLLSLSFSLFRSLSVFSGLENRVFGNLLLNQYVLFKANRTPGFQSTQKKRTKNDCRLSQVNKIVKVCSNTPTQNEVEAIVCGIAFARITFSPSIVRLYRALSHRLFTLWLKNQQFLANQATNLIFIHYISGTFDTVLKAACDV